MFRRPQLGYLVLLPCVCLLCGGAGCGSGGAKDGAPGGNGGQVGTGGNSASGGTTTSIGATGGSTTSSAGGIPSGGVGGDGATGGDVSGGDDATTGSGGAAGLATGAGGYAAGGAATGGTVTGGNAGGATGGSTTPSAGGTRSDGTGGNGVGGNSSGGTGGVDPFALAWKDNFDTLDTSLWQPQSFTWDGNQAQFTPQNVSVAGGKLAISLTDAPSGSAKPYLGVELRSTKTLTYGKVSASMRFASGSGVVSGLVLFYTPYPNCNWNEIDIEHLGNSSNTSQLNCQVYIGTPATNCTTSVAPTQDPQVVNLGIDAEAAFHQYDIEWTPAGVKFFVDGTLLRTWSTNISLLKLPQNILLTIWASDSASWAGSLNAASAPTSAEVDWIKVYGWNG